MENPFKVLIPNETLPAFIKTKVMDDIDLIKLSLELADLLAIKYPDAINDMLNNGNESND
jgi:hypothetical protein